MYTALLISELIESKNNKLCALNQEFVLNLLPSLKYDRTLLLFRSAAYGMLYFITFNISELNFWVACVCPHL